MHLNCVLVPGGHIKSVRFFQVVIFSRKADSEVSSSTLEKTPAAAAPLSKPCHSMHYAQDPVEKIKYVQVKCIGMMYHAQDPHCGVW